MSIQKELTQKLKAMNLQNTDLLLVKGHDLAEAVAGLKLQWPNDNKRKIYIVVVQDTSDLRALDEEQMKKAGWRRVRPMPFNLGEY